MQPCLFMDTATASTIEGAATTVYAQGGQGNPRLIAWEGEKTVTFTVTDALLSSISFAMLSGAGVVSKKFQEGAEDAYLVHKQHDGLVVIEGTGDEASAIIEIPYVAGESLSAEPAYAYLLDNVGGVEHYFPAALDLSQYNVAEGKDPEKNAAGELVYKVAIDDVDTNDSEIEGQHVARKGDVVRVDYYVKKLTGVTELQITADQFAGYYYIEADTLFRDEETGADFAACFIIPKGKIQSNFTFSMASSGDPSTFDFTIDAFPAFVRGGANKAKKVLFTLQMLTAGEESHPYADPNVHGHNAEQPDFFNNHVDPEDEGTSLYGVTTKK